MKIGLVMICTGENYWPYAKQVIDSAKKYLLPGHEVDYLMWSDMPGVADYGIDKLFPTEQTAWPYPTLMRYHLFLQQEELLKTYDYIFYCDVDMLFVDIVGDEILGQGITAAQHPMYAFRKEYIFPLEKNPKSTAHVKVPQFYYAGGFQGGTTESFLKAMWSCKRAIDQDFSINYLARWNDESHWNRYLFDNPPAITLSPSYIYPDSLIEEYYKKIWGCEYHPRLVTLTKKFTTTKEGGDAVKDAIATL